MDKNVEFSLLLDFYGALLTDRQRDIINLYYNMDYSLSEIADDLDISRQGVRDSLKRAEEILAELEKKLGFVFRISDMRSEISLISTLCEAALENASNESMKEALENIKNKANKLIGT